MRGSKMPLLAPSSTSSMRLSKVFSVLKPRNAMTETNRMTTSAATAQEAPWVCTTSYTAPASAIKASSHKPVAGPISSRLKLKNEFFIADPLFGQ